jgi:hypothetical protein
LELPEEVPKRENEPQKVQAPAEPERPAIGAPFNPYYLLVRGEFNRAVMASPDLTDASAKLLLLLADQCERLGYDTHSQDNLAPLCGWKPRKLRRHIAELKTAGLIDVICPDGKHTFTAFLYHPLFANCSLYDRSKIAYQVGQKWPTRSAKFGLHMDLPHGSNHGIGNSTSNVGRGIVNASEARAEVESQNQTPKKPSFQIPITNRVSTPQVLPDFKAHWYKLSPLEKTRHMERVARAVAYIEDRRQHIESPDKSIKSCARREVKKYLDELRALGFFIPGIEPKGKA